AGGGPGAGAAVRRAPREEAAAAEEEALPEAVADAPEMTEDTAPMLEVAAGAWEAATEHRLSPRGRDASHAAALLEDIASDARAREDEARSARDQACDEPRRRRAGE